MEHSLKFFIFMSAALISLGCASRAVSPESRGPAAENNQSVKGADAILEVKKAWEQIAGQISEKTGDFDAAMGLGRNVPCKLRLSIAADGTSQTFKILKDDGSTIDEMTIFSSEIYIHYKSPDTSSYFESWETDSLNSPGRTEPQDIVMKFAKFTSPNADARLESSFSIAHGGESTCNWYDQ
jgi:hypothetical protein